MKTTMKTILIPLIAAAACMADQPSTPATPTPPPSPAAPPATGDLLKKTGDIMMHYFQHPDPGIIGELITDVSKAFPDTRQCNAIPSMIVFFGEIFKSNPGRVDEWMKTASSLPEDWQQIFRTALQYAQGKIPDVSTAQTAGPSTLDACWGGYLASGDKKYPEAVLRIACSDEPENSLDVTIRAAAWSASSFIMQYDEMKKIAREFFADATERQKLNFAGRTNEEVQKTVFGTVLKPEKETDDE